MLLLRLAVLATVAAVAVSCDHTVSQGHSRGTAARTKACLRDFDPVPFMWAAIGTSGHEPWFSGQEFSRLVPRVLQSFASRPGQAQTAKKNGGAPYGAAIVDPAKNETVVYGQNHASLNPIWCAVIATRSSPR